MAEDEVVDAVVLHCLHFTWYGQSYGTGGAEQHQCCRCGVMVWRKWKLEQRPLEGHGPYVEESVRVYRDEPIGECAGRYGY